ncbi:MAG: hypothetical protein DIU78_012565 [Pseudomonadota bacterium]
MTPLFSNLRPIRLRLGTWLDVVLISDPEHIRWLDSQQHVERRIDPERGWLHRIVDRRLRVDMGFDGEVLPVFRARSDAKRAERQRELMARFDALRGLPGPERNEIAGYVANPKQKGRDIGVLVQQWCGRLFLPQYRATKESYAAGRRLARFPAQSPFAAWRQRVDGRLDRAKEVLMDLAEGDLHCVHGTSIGMENVVRTVRNLRNAARSEAQRGRSLDEVLRECLVAPPVVLRTCTADVEAPFLRKPLTPHTLIVVLVSRAFAASGDLDVAFLSQGWSACPARRVILDMLRAVWSAVRQEDGGRRVPFDGVGRSWDAHTVH